MSKIALYICGALAALAVLAPVSAQAQDVETVQKAAIQKLNLAGRKAMLSQRIAQAVCFASHGLDPLNTKQQVQQAQWLFEMELGQMRDGDAAQGVAAETDQAALEAISQMASLWSPFNDALSGWMGWSGDVAKHVTSIYQTNQTLAEQAEVLAGVLRDRFLAAGALPEDAAQKLVIKHQLRMLTQKISKEYCFVAYNHEKAEYAPALKASMRQYDLLTAALIDGSAELRLTPAGPEAAAQLNRARSEYKRITPILEFAVAGEALPSDYNLLVMNQTSLMLAELNKASFSFEKSAAN